MKTLYHISSEGQNVIFRSEDDFIYFMNKLGIASEALDVRIFAFCIMSTHFHAVIQTDNVAHYTKTLNGLYGRHLALKYGIGGHKMKFSCNTLQDIEYITSAIEYVLRNPVHHNVATNAFEYPYSSVRVPYPDVFNPPKRYLNENLCIEQSIKHPNELPYQEKKWIFGRFRHNDKWLVKDGKLILPESYVDNSLVKEIYKSFRSYFYGMTQNKNSSNAESNLTAYKISDIKVCRIVDNILMQQGHSLDTLPLSVENDLRRILYGYGANDAQIDRCLWKLS
ncbi:MAG: hypothetical protein HUJ98_10905 [Bacteroidaceae bacterium]|nr:hypothetical protein [Bacteroidaceae bacterium]